MKNKEALFVVNEGINPLNHGPVSFYSFGRTDFPGTVTLLIVLEQPIDASDISLEPLTFEFGLVLHIIIVKYFSSIVIWQRNSRVSTFSAYDPIQSESSQSPIAEPNSYIARTPLQKRSSTSLSIY